MSALQLLIAYDGSPDAQSALRTAATMFPGASAVVLYARQALEGFAAHLEGHPALEELAGLDAATLDVSERIADEGAQLARGLGFDAEPRVSSTMSTASEAIVDTAEEVDADLIMVGSRGRRGFKATLLGSTSASVLHHATRPTLVIPSDSVASARRAGRTEMTHHSV
ncbi:universal stress protein [Arthrobacter sp. Br18]|uniref:universal stress protein n=1 Tax=Arthrobacter sp. Br18 TaxID=1312954 RepID=UPI00047B8201|nr:universal stress protein [Arthrobacter sp. Br18]